MKVNILFAAFLLFSVALYSCNADACSAGDYIHEYTQCRQDNTHSLIYYKDPSSACTDTTSIPQNLYNLPCNISCEDGQYVELGASSCSNCTAGTFNKGSAIYADYWATWPQGLNYKTWCYSTSKSVNCSGAGWYLNEYALRSGHINDSMTSVIQFDVVLVSEGHITFTYFMSTEICCDRLHFYVDNVEEMVFYTTGSVATITYNLDVGAHQIRFEYVKDFSESQGTDSVEIQVLDIGGVYYAWDNVCVNCHAGTYASSSGSTSCTACPANTVSTGMGATTCQPCKSNEYSFPGSDSCMTKLPCTADDYELITGPCTASGHRITAQWMLPVICDTSSGVSLPAPTYQSPCVPCEGGFYRNGLQCVVCPDGYYRASEDVLGGCVPCDAGTAAVKTFDLTEWTDWLPFMQSGCDGDCGTPQWRMKGDFIDAGIGHGYQVSSWFELDVDVELDTYLEFSYELVCSQPCLLTVTDVIDNSEASGDGTDPFPYVLSTPNERDFGFVPVVNGSHHFRFTFTKSVGIGNGLSRNDTVRISEISIQYVTQGGATYCQDCYAGTYSQLGASVCSVCGAGSASLDDGTGCAQCSDNDFNPTPGGVCTPCGDGTFASDDHTSCIDPCSVLLSDPITGNTIQYDLNPIAAQGILGPAEFTFFKYTLNVCGVGGFDSGCHAKTNPNQPLMSHICQFDTHALYGINLGMYSAYDMLNGTTRGVLVHYTGGDVGCFGLHRSSSVAYICDPTATKAVFTPANATVQPFEQPNCRYHFEVRSLYACPICSQADYTFYYTTCNNNKRLKVYYWADEPRQCYSGLTLPPPDSVDCISSTIQCPAGQFLDQSSGISLCTSCEPGFYSIGGGEYVNSWLSADPNIPLVAPFVSYCSGAGCSNWADAGYSVQSGNGASILSATYTLKTTGSVSFNYKIYSAEVGQLIFTLDGTDTVLNTAGISVLTVSTFTANLAAGLHHFVWKFTAGNRAAPSSGLLESAIITDFTVLGTDYSGQCTPCPSGTYSGPAASSCLPCPMNTFSPGTALNCTACPDKTYSLGGDGAYECLPKPLCTLNDFWKVYEDCNAGQRVISHAPLLPTYCDAEQSFENDQTVPCGQCPPSLFWSNYASACIACAETQYYDNTTSSCLDVPAGSATVLREYFFLPDYTPLYIDEQILGKRAIGDLPVGFSTACSGQCGSPGWRWIGDGADSGYQSDNTVDSYLKFNAHMVVDGSISFTYNVIGDISIFSGLQVEVDDSTVPIPVPLPGQDVDVSVPIPAGNHVVTWNYHQDVGDNGLVQIRNVVLTGTNTGSAVPVPCPAGTSNKIAGVSTCTPCHPGFSSAAGAADCTPCPANTYSAVPSAAQCVPCPSGSSAPNTGSAYCQTSCVFGASPLVFDLTAQTTPVGPVFSSDGITYTFSLCDVFKTGSCPATHVCAKTADNKLHDGGDALSFISVSNASDTTEYFQLRFDYGDNTLCLDKTQTASAVVTFSCDTERSEHAPRYSNTDSDSCTMYFTWNTILGCPVCQDSDYQTAAGACDGSSQTFTKYRSSLCNGPASIALASQSCTIATPPGTVAAAVIAVLAFVIIVVGGGYCYYRQKTITKKYAQMANRDRASTIELQSSVSVGTTNNGILN